MTGSPDTRVSRAEFFDLLLHTVFFLTDGGTSVDEIRGFNPHVVTRDGFDFTVTIGKVDRPAFITFTGLAVLRGDLAGDDEFVFNERWSRIAVAVARKAASIPADAEIFITSDDINAI